MRWRMIDRVDALQPWTSITGTKTISFEEGQLLGWTGWDGAFPGTLLIEACVELARWLVARSSGFTHSCLLERIGSFQFDRTPMVGDRLQITVRVSSRADDALTVACCVADDRGEIAGGMLSLELVYTAEYCDPESEAALWQEIHGTA